MKGLSKVSTRSVVSKRSGSTMSNVYRKRKAREVNYGSIESREDKDEFMARRVNKQLAPAHEFQQ